MGLIVKHHNKYIKKHKLKHSDKNLINFKKYHPYKSGDKKKDENFIYYECGKSYHYSTTCLSLNKCTKKKDKYSSKTKGNNVKGRRAYIT